MSRLFFVSAATRAQRAEWVSSRDQHGRSLSICARKYRRGNPQAGRLKRALRNEVGDDVDQQHSNINMESCATFGFLSDALRFADALGSRVSVALFGGWASMHRDW